MKDGTFTEPIVQRKLMNDSYSQQCVGTCVCTLVFMCGRGFRMFVCEEEAAVDGDPVVVCCLRYTFICCLLLCLFKNALEPTAETSIYICHRSEGGEGGPTLSHHGFQYLLELWR